MEARGKDLQQLLHPQVACLIILQAAAHLTTVAAPPMRGQIGSPQEENFRVRILYSH